MSRPRSSSLCSISTASRATTMTSVTPPATLCCSVWPARWPTVLRSTGASIAWAATSSARCCPVEMTDEALLRAAIAVLQDRGDGFSISASVGSVLLPEETDDVEEALRLADQRMYAHKHQVRRADTAQEVKQALLSALPSVIPSFQATSMMSPSSPGHRGGAELHASGGRVHQNCCGASRRRQDGDPRDDPSEARPPRPTGNG